MVSKLHTSQTHKNAFPNLALDNHDVTSPENTYYNCIAWAMDENDVWWWPDSMNIKYWPDDAPREQTIDAFIKAFSLKNYQPCKDGSLKQGYEKIALFALNQLPTHASRQLPSGKWTSKLGESFDISHFADALDGPFYGSTVLFFERQIS